jgi:hypothetical protein
MATVANDPLPIEACAYSLAFQSGQLLEMLLLDQAAEAARRSGSSVIRAEHILSCIDEIPIDQFRMKLDERTTQASGEAA